MAAAYAQADGGPLSNELKLLAVIDRFGSQAVFGSEPIPANILNKMIMAEGLFLSYKARGAASNWAEWAAENPKVSKLLNRITMEVAENDNN